MTGQLPPCAHGQLCGYDEDLDDCPCWDGMHDGPPPRPVTDVPIQNGDLL